MVPFAARPPAPSLPAPQVIMPGYCVQGTVGHKILSGQRKLEMEGRQVVSPHVPGSPTGPPTRAGWEPWEPAACGNGLCAL